MPTTHYNATQNQNLTTSLDGGALAGGDSVIVNKWSYDHNMGTDLTATDLALFQLKDGFSGRFRSQDTGALKLKCDQAGAGIFRNESNSPWIELTSTDATTKIATVENAPVRGDAQLICSSMLATNFYQQSGRSTLADTVACTTFYQLGGAAYAMKSGNALTTVYVMSGQLTCERNITTAHVMGGPGGGVGGRGELVIQDVAASVTTVNMDGGKLTLIEAADGAMTINGYAGEIDITRLRRNLTLVASTFYPTLIIRYSKKNTSTVTWNNTDKRGGAKFVAVD